MDWNTLVLFGIAVLNAYTAWAALQTRSDIRTLEKNTNSIKDALVAATAKASRGEGVLAGRAEQRAESETKRK